MGTPMNSTTCSWSSPKETPRLLPDEVHLWLLRLEGQELALEDLRETLSGDEQTKARGFRFERLRRRYIVCRGILRKLIGDYLQQEPSQIRFQYQAKGKPVLDKRSSEGLQFNLSHSEGIALLALTRHREIGVDVEFVRLLSDAKKIAERFFSQRERADLGGVASKDQTAAFFNCWTRKEAYLKARGEGMSRELDQFSVSLVPGEPARLLSVQWDPKEVGRWSMLSLRPTPDYVAALVVEGRDWKPRYCQWSVGSP